MITRATLSTIEQGLPKYRSMLAGNAAYVPPSFESIATANGTGSSDTITFSSIPSTFQHLQIRYTARCTAGAMGYMRFNSDSATNYSWHHINGTGSATSAAGYATQAQIGIAGANSGIESQQSTVGIIDILDYKSTSKNKTVRVIAGLDVNAAGGDIGLNSGLWRNTNAITSITITTLGTNFTTATTFALYGIKG